MSRVHRVTAVCGSAVAVLALVAGCAAGKQATPTPTVAPPTSTAPPPTGKPVKIGLINQENETVAFPEGSKAAKAAVAYLNAERGGIGGRPVELELCTTGDSAESAVACANKFANDDSVPLVISNTYNSAAVDKILLGRKTVFTFNMDIPDMTTKGIFTLDTGTLIPAGVLVQILKDKGAKNIAIMYTDDPETKSSVLPLAQTAAKAAGLNIQQNIPVAAGSDYTASVSALDASKVDGVLMLLVDTAQCAPVGQALTALGVNKPVASIDICSAPTIVSTGGVDSWQFAVTNVGSLDPSTGNKDTLEFRRVMETYGGKDPDLATLAGFTFGQVMAATDLYNHVGVDNATPETLNAALANGWSATPFPYVPVSCPGAAPFTGECATSMYWAEADGGKLKLAKDEPVKVDLSVFADLAK
jgi:branched-chain amino acid transport system substrate-binding protein